MPDPTRVQVFGIIPAAGRSTRMGRPKQLLRVGRHTMLEHVIEAVLAGDVNGLCVVTSSTIDGELRLSEDPRLIVAINDDGDSEMLDSVRTGVTALGERCEVKHLDGHLVCPGDMPRVPADAVSAAADAYRAAPGSIVIAAYRGTRGHPMVFPAALAAEVAEIAGGGLNVLVERHADLVRLVEWTTPGVVRNVNMPEDYTRLRGITM